MISSMDLLARSQAFRTAVFQLMKEHEVHGAYFVWIDSNSNDDHQTGSDGNITMGSTSSAGFGCESCGMVALGMGLKNLPENVRHSLVETLEAIQKGKIHSESQHVVQQHDLDIVQ